MRKVIMIKRTLLFIVSFAVCVILLFGCGAYNNVDGGGRNSDNDKNNGETLKIVTTIFPIYDWTREILGENPAGAELVMLLDSGVDLHSFQPTAKDILDIATCDLFIYVGGESDDWVEDALKENENPDRVTLNLLDVLGEYALEEEIVEGMQAEEDDEDARPGTSTSSVTGMESTATEETGTSTSSVTENVNEEPGTSTGSVTGNVNEEPGTSTSSVTGMESTATEETGTSTSSVTGLEYDEHIWLSFINANVLCSAIADALAGIDSENAAVYEANFSDYALRLDALESEYEAMVMASPKDVVLFGDRFPFRYLMDEYAIQYYAAFPGCEAETEASFATITFLAEKVDELGLNCILTIDGGEGKVAETILQNTRDKNQTILTLNSMQGVTSTDVESGVTYIQIMEDNLQVLRDALS